MLFRGDNLVALDSTWAGEAIQIPVVLPEPELVGTGQFEGLPEGLIGMQVGGRRAITIPPEQAFGAEGNPQLGLPAGADTILVVDLLGAY